MTAVITGAGTGIGRAIAVLFAREGANTVVAGRRMEPLEKTASAIEEAGGRAVAVAADLTVRDDVRRLADVAKETFDRIDVLVNNAGAVVSRTTVLDCAEDDWRATIDANLHSAFLCSKQMLPELIRTKGNIVHVASVFSLVGAANSAAYSAAKGGLVSLTRAMAMDFGAAGVRVNAVCPAYVETDLNREMLDGLRRAGKFDTVLSRLPLGRLGEPDDVAFAALYLAAPEARWITGAALPVDGGMSAGRG
jgi:meso-butanediol dehydrogenase/(S,S)-butanediol dehydrogenase/diacetyl reductase